MENTLIIFKPDAMNRGLVGRILDRFEQKSFQIVALKMISITKKVAREHYDQHRKRSFFPSVVDFITSSPVIIGVLAGNDAVDVVRKMLGATFGNEAEPGTIRGDFTISKACNLVHASDSREAATREINLFFTPEEIHDWEAAYVAAADLTGEE